MKIKAVINIIFVMILIITISITIYAAINSSQWSQKVNFIDFNDDWEYTVDGKTQLISVSTKKFSSNETIILKKQLPDELPEDAIFYFSSNHNHVKAYIDGKELFIDGIYDNRTFNLHYIASWGKLALAKEHEGKTLTLTIKIDNIVDSFSISKIRILNENDLTKDIIIKNIDTILLFSGMITLAIITLVIGIVYVKRTDTQFSPLVYLTIFIVLSAVWILSNSIVLETVFGYNDYQYFLAFFSFMLMPVPFLLYFKARFVGIKYVIDTIVFLFFIAFALSFILFITGVINSFANTLWIFHLLIVISLLYIAIVSTINYKKNKNPNLKLFIVGTVVFVLLVISALIFFYLEMASAYASAFKIGLFVFVLCVSIGAIKRAIDVVRKATDFEKLSQTIPCGICKIKLDNKMTIIYANNFYYEMFGYTAQEAKNVGFVSVDYVVVPDDMHKIFDIISDCINKNQDKYFEVELREKDVNNKILYILARCNCKVESNELIASVINITDRKIMEQDVRVSEEEYRIAAEHSEKCILRYDIATKRIYQQFDRFKIFGDCKVIENVPNSILAKGIVAPESVSVYKEFYNAMQRGEKNGKAICCIKNLKGENIWLKNEFTTIYDDYGKALHTIISYYDISKLRELTLSYEKWKQSIADMPQKTICLLEYNLTKDIIMDKQGQLLDDILIKNESNNDRTNRLCATAIFVDDVLSYKSLMLKENLITMYKNGRREHEFTFRLLLDKHYRYLSLNIQLIGYSDSQDIKAYMLYKDVDDEVNAKLLLEKRSITDSLTGVLNREAFKESLENMISNCNANHALIMLDIDSFKSINDSYGHDYGDSALVKLVDILKHMLRENDLLGRIGGDEFIFCLKDIPNYETLHKRIEEIRIGLEYQLDNGFKHSVSMGVTFFNNGAFDELYKNADIALYKAKQQGKNKYVLYNENMKNGQRRINNY
ncbi:MAG: diguanylate cyclase [Clostridia bacterium]